MGRRDSSQALSVSFADSSPRGRAKIQEKGGNMERCPVCGRVVPTHVYVRNAEIVGCDGCLTPFEIWELPETMEVT